MTIPHDRKIHHNNVLHTTPCTKHTRDALALCLLICLSSCGCASERRASSVWLFCLCRVLPRGGCALRPADMVILPNAVQRHLRVVRCCVLFQWICGIVQWPSFPFGGLCTILVAIFGTYLLSDDRRLGSRCFRMFLPLVSHQTCREEEGIMCVLDTPFFFSERSTLTLESMRKPPASVRVPPWKCSIIVGGIDAPRATMIGA